MKLPNDFPTYAYHHLQKSQKNLDEASMVFSDLSQSETSTAFILGLDT